MRHSNHFKKFTVFLPDGENTLAAEDLSKFCEFYGHGLEFINPPIFKAEFKLWNKMFYNHLITSRKNALLKCKTREREIIVSTSELIQKFCKKEDKI